MKINKCPVGALWLFLAVPVYWIAAEQNRFGHQLTKLGNCLKIYYSPIQIRPPPL